MTEETVNIRVYRTTSPLGHHLFESKFEDGQNKAASSSIQGLAGNALIAVKYFHSKGYQNVGIDFLPFHNIDCAFGEPPRICTPLTATEQEEFWKFFSKE
jgi:hypothetical protein